jgi:protein-disulfide isomerase
VIIPKWRAALDLLVTVLMLVLIVLTGWRHFGRNNPPPQPPPPPPAVVPADPIPLDGAHLLGKSEAPVAVVMCVDYACAGCRVFETETLPSIIREYVDTGRVQLAVRPFPLSARREAALEEAALAECAGRQGRFWEAHAVLFEEAQASREQRRRTVAAATGIALESLASCLADAGDLVQRRLAEARKLGVRGTPTFLIGALESSGRVAIRKAHQGASPGDAWFRQLLDPVLATTETR